MGITRFTFLSHCSLSRLSGLGLSSCQQFGLTCLISSALLSANSVQGMSLTQWTFYPEKQQIQFTWESQNHSNSSFDSLVPHSFILSNPTRIVIDLPHTELQTKPIKKRYSGLISEIRIAQFQPQVTRIVLELAPDAHLDSKTVTLVKLPTPKENQWQITPKIERNNFPLSTLLKIPPLESHQKPLTTIQVPPPPSTTNAEDQLPLEKLSLSAGTQFVLSYRGKNPLTLEVEQPWQEVLFLENPLTNQNGDLIIPAQTPVIGHFETTSQGTRFITHALISTLVIPISARSQIFPSEVQSSRFEEITIPPNTTFTLELTEDWHYQR